nr:unnamed protein product [Callosobruchus chinensis]
MSSHEGETDMLSDWLSNMQKRTMSIRNQHLKNIH